MTSDTPIIHVLLIEDDEDDYLILRDCLSEVKSPEKFELEWVTDYQSGLSHFHRGNHDVYLVDYFLGEHTGLDLLKEAIRTGCQKPVVMITGQSSPEIDLASLAAGATDYLEKSQINSMLLERSIRYAIERNRLMKQIRELAVRDALTGLFNRRELHRFLEYEVIKSHRYNHPFSILLMDIDNFKEINDTVGHRMGDEILQQVANVLLRNTRGCDLPSRYGGDEFIIVLPETPAGGAWIAGERLRKVVESLPISLSNENQITENLKITVSVGLAEFPYDATSADFLIDMADKALYQAKHQGCNQVVCYHLKRGIG